MANTIKQIIVLGAILALAGIVGASVFLGGTSEKVSATNTNTITGNSAKTIKTISDNSGDVQEVQLTFKNYEYQLEPSTLQKDVPVRMTVDLNTVTGCMRSIVISSFDVREYVSTSDNIIEFTPDKAGTFNIACSMNMGRGTFSVVDSSGSTSGFVEAAPTAVEGGSCGADGGGCGCGGA